MWGREEAQRRWKIEIKNVWESEKLKSLRKWGRKWERWYEQNKKMGQLFGWKKWEWMKKKIWPYLLFPNFKHF